VVGETARGGRRGEDQRKDKGKRRVIPKERGVKKLRNNGPWGDKRKKMILPGGKRELVGFSRDSADPSLPGRKKKERLKKKKWPGGKLRSGWNFIPKVLGRNCADVWVGGWEKRGLTLGKVGWC